MIHILCIILLTGVIITVILLDVFRKMNLMHPLCLAIYLIIAQNLILWPYYLYQETLSALAPQWRLGYLIVLGFFILYLWARLNIFPVMDGKKVNIRLKVMMGGRFITYCALWAMFLEILFLTLGYRFFRNAGVPTGVLVANGIYGAIILFSLFLNGILRIFFTSKRLSIVRRVIMLLTMWIPLVNLAVLVYACRLVYEEYDFACNKEELRHIRAESDLCRTKYPLIMVHGVLFRDLKYFNYWGRIPKELIRYGATIYYGNQEAVGTIVNNAQDLKAKIEEVMAETGCEKVNIIAHSKGGLDARYAVTALNMGQYVASLTTMNTPHRGCRFVDKACNLPEGVYRFIAKIFDNSFRKLGDKNPDFYTATRQFATVDSEEFNRNVPDDPRVYYQSYTSRMKNIFSDSLLCIPYAMIKPLEGENDGLVSVSSAVWGNYRGLIESKGRRGISHGDIIDLKREDYKGFDVIEAYVNIVGDLKAMGF